MPALVLSAVVVDTTSVVLSPAESELVLKPWGPVVGSVDVVSSLEAPLTVTLAAVNRDVVAPSGSLGLNRQPHSKANGVKANLRAAFIEPSNLSYVVFVAEMWR